MYFDTKSKIENLINSVMDKKIYYVSFVDNKFRHEIIRDMRKALAGIYSNPDKRFVEELENVSLGMKSNYCSFVSLYIVLNGYLKHKDNFDSFKVLSRDVGSFKYVDLLMPSSVFELRDVFKIFDSLISNKNYDSMSNTRAFLKKMCENLFRYTFDEKEFIDFYNKCYKIYDDALELGVDCDKASLIFDEMIGQNISGVTSYSKRLFYNKILVIGDRFKYFNDTIQKIEVNHFIKEDIFHRVSNLNIDLFNQLSEGSIKDSFITCMDSLFDSDSYFELNNKLRLLEKASDAYASGDKKGAFNLVTQLNKQDLVKTYCRKLVSYPKNCMNLVAKPERILQREKELYEKIDDTCDYNELDNITTSVRSLVEAVEISDRITRSLQKPLSKLLRKGISYVNRGNENDG